MRIASAFLIPFVAVNASTFDVAVATETTAVPATTEASAVAETAAPSTVEPTTEAPTTTTPIPLAVTSRDAPVGPVDMASPTLARGRRGIANEGLTCHLNVALQTISHSRALRALLMPIAAHPLAEEGSLVRIQAIRVVNELATVFAAQWGESELAGSSVAIDARPLREAIREMVGYGFGPREMEDAQRSTGVLLEALATALTPVDGSASPFDALMQSRLTKTLTCPTTNQTRTVNETLLDLSIPLNPYKQHMPLEESFSLFLADEVLEGIDCSSCGVRHNTPVSHAVVPAPLLLLSIKRHSPDGRKYGTWIHYPLEFNMAEYIPGGEGVYRLIGIVHHVGPAGAGHYLADFLHPDDGRWYRADDRTVTPIAGGRPVPSGPSQTALMYERV
jgi:hypothetical protein